jgi:hypothetical protein
MTKLGPSQETVASFMDTLATEMDALTQFSEPTNTLANDQSTNDWYNNAFVRNHDPTGRTLLFYITSNDQDGHGIDYDGTVEGIRLIVSDGWDSNNDVPSGKSNLRSDDPVSQTSADDMDTSYNLQNANARYADGVTLGWFAYEDSDKDRDVLATQDIDYVGSIDSEGFNIGVWSSAHSDDGAASYMSVYHLTETFWTIPQDNFATYAKHSIDNHQSASLGWEYIHTQDNSFSYDWQWYPDHDTGNYKDLGIGYGHWGIINPDTNDDKIFFRFPIIFQSPGYNVPVQYLKTTIPNDPVDGAAHGDVVTHDGVDYKIFIKRGDGIESNNVNGGNEISLGIRWK